LNYRSAKFTNALKNTAATLCEIEL